MARKIIAQKKKAAPTKPAHICGENDPVLRKFINITPSKKLPDKKNTTVRPKKNLNGL
jgi:hypothetical protein